MSKLTIDTAAVFAPLLQPARYKGAHGGRGSGKSWFWADETIEALLRGKNVVCIREIQNSIADSVKRLKLGLEALAGYRNHDGLLVSNGTDVMYEHSETWDWVTGESAVLQFVTVHKVVDGAITVWKDYWDFAGLLNHAPADWMEQLSQGDMSWMFDATGLV